MVPRELKAQLRELDTTCNLSSFLKGLMKMADIDNDPFGDHDKKEKHSLTKQVKLSLST